MAIVRQLGSGQDYVVKGSFTKETDEYDYIAAMDGHSGHACITILRDLDFNEVAQQVDPVDYIQSRLQKYNLRNSGSTFTFARINKTKRQIEIINIGDSKTVLFKNEELMYSTPDHCFQNPEEVERTKSLVQSIQKSHAPKPVNDTDVHLFESNVGIWSTGEKLVPSQSFGHNNITGLAPSRIIIPYYPDDKIRVICGTDGFWDMNMIQYPYIATESAIRLVNVAERKWKQQWMYFSKIHPPFQTAFDSADDIGIAIWEK